MGAGGLLLAFGVATLGLLRGALGQLAPLDRWILATGGALIAIALASLATCRLGIFSTWSVLSLVVVASAPFYFRVRSAQPRARERWTIEHAGLAALLVIFLALFAFYPTYFLLGGQDPGVYLALAANIAKKGGLNVDQPALPLVYEKLGGAGLMLGYPGFYSLYGRTQDMTRLSPQFMHLFPAFGANFWRAAGVEGIVRANAVIGVTSLALAYALARRLGGILAAFVFVVALGLNPAFVWGARIALTEQMALALNLGGLLLLLVARERVSWRFGLAAGIVLGVGVLDRLDGGLAGLAVLGFSIAAALTERTLRRVAVAASFGYLVVSSLGHLDGKINSPIYFEDLVKLLELGTLIAMSTACGVVGVLLPLVPPRWLDFLRLDERWLRFGAPELLRALVAWSIFAVFVWPRLETVDDSARAATELGWYVTPVAWPLAFLGFGLALRERAWAKWLPLMALFAGTLVVYTRGAGVVPVHIWASRRWLPHLLPLMLLFAIVGARTLAARNTTGRWGAPLLGVGLSLAYLVPTLAYTRLFLFQSMLRELPEAYERFASYAKKQKLRPPFITANVQMASILNYVYDLPTVVLRPEGGRAALGRGVIAGYTGVGFNAYELGHEIERLSVVHATYLEVAEKRIPSRLVDIAATFDVGPISGATFEIDVPANDPSLVSPAGRFANDGIHTTGRAGQLQNGPWATLTPGDYEIDWIGRVNAVGAHPAGTLDVITQGGRSTLAEAPLAVRKSKGEVWLGGLDFTLTEITPGVEFRVRVGADVNLVITRIRFRRARAR